MDHDLFHRKCPRLVEPSFAWTLRILDHTVHRQAVTSGCPKLASYCWPVGSRLVLPRNVPNPVLGSVLLSLWCRRTKLTKRMRCNARIALPGCAPTSASHCSLYPVWASELPPCSHGDREKGKGSSRAAPRCHGPPCAMKGQVPHVKSWEGCWCQREKQGLPKQKREKQWKIKVLLSAEPHGFHTQKGSLLQDDEDATRRRTGQLSWAGSFSDSWQGLVMQIFCEYSRSKTHCQTPQIVEQFGSKDRFQKWKFSLMYWVQIAINVLSNVLNMSNVGEGQ